MGAHKRMIVVGDRVLIRPERGEERTKVGLYLPQTAVDQKAVQGGRVAEVGPGVPFASLADPDAEPWKETPPSLRYIPMQAQVGDFALFLKSAAVEVTFDGQKYLIVPQSSILLLIRGDDVFPEEEPLPPAGG